jgi:4-hydroxy-2-oxoheptanedioate aldolase
MAGGRRDNAGILREEAPMSELRDILRNHMKEKLARGEVVASMTVRLCRTIEIAQIAKTAGFDTIYVDMEHNTLTIGETCQICIAAEQIGITPLVRVPANSPEYICRVLDGGAMGGSRRMCDPPRRRGKW